MQGSEGLSKVMQGGGSHRHKYMYISTAVYATQVRRDLIPHLRSYHQKYHTSVYCKAVNKLQKITRECTEHLNQHIDM